MSMIDILYNENIKLRSYSEGSYKTKCSACQPPHDAKDNPLSVTIQSDHHIIISSYHEDCACTFQTIFGS